MCFPGKRFKKNHSDDPESAKAPASAAPAPTTTPAPAPAPAPATQTAPETTMSSPKVAIIIYSLYGHIAKCAYLEPPASINTHRAHIFSG